MIKSTKVTQKTGLVMVNEFVHGHSPPDKRVQLKRKVVSLKPRQWDDVTRRYGN